MPSGRDPSLYLTREAPKPMAGRLLDTHHIIHCRMPWKAASTVFAGQNMQTPTVHPPAAAARMRNTNISAHSKGYGNPKTLGVQK